MMYKLYNYYIFMFLFCVCAYVSYRKKRNNLMNTTIEKAIVAFLIFSMGLGCSIIIWWIPVSLTGELIRVGIGVILSIFIGWNSIVIANGGIVLCKKIISNDFLKQFGYGSAIFVLWMIQLIIQLPEKIIEWVECWYAADYSMGIGSRFFIGTVLSLFYDDYLDAKVVYRFCMITVVLVIALCSFMLGKLLNDTKYKVAVAFLVACFWACPASLASYWMEDNIGRLEFYTLFVALLSVLIFLNCKKRWMKYSLLCVSVIISNAIYQGYVFLYFPLIFIILICEIYKSEYKKSEVIGAGVVFFCACASFLFFQLGSSINYETQEAFEMAIREKSNLRISSEAIKYEMFMSIPEVFEKVNVPFALGDRFPREMSAITVLIFAPIAVIGIAIYMKCFEQHKMKKQHCLKNPYLWAVVCQLAILPQFLLNVDWGRWFIAVVIVFFFGVFYMLYVDMEEMHVAIAALDRFVKKNYFLAVGVVLYLSLFAKLTDQGMRTQIVFIIKNITRLIS